MTRNCWDYQPRDLGRSVMLDLPKPLPVWPLNVMVLLRGCARRVNDDVWTAHDHPEHRRTVAECLPLIRAAHGPLLCIAVTARSMSGGGVMSTVTAEG
jgi:hypothetical protein